MQANIGVVIVTFNRLEKLKKTLTCFKEQDLSPKYVLVVNNNSSDGTKEFLETWKKDDNCQFKKMVIHEKENLGGSGGFHVGLEKAKEMDAEWIWVSDNDAYPQKNTIKVANDFITNNTNEKLLAICASVLDMDDNIAYGHRKRVENGLLKISINTVPAVEYEKEAFKLNAFSYVGAIIKKTALVKYGTTKSDYFIWFDDTEHSLRISEHGDIVCVPAIKVNHENELGGAAYDWREYYGLRNEMDMYKNHFPKRCYRFKVITRFLKSVYLMFGHDKEYYHLYKKALMDSIRGNLGKDDKYKPGWKPNIN